MSENLHPNIYVASSPFQLFNCIEARNRFHRDACNIAFLVYRREIDRRQMEVLLDSRWHKVVWFRWSALNRITYPHRIPRLLRPHRYFNHIYLGYPFNIRAHIANSLPHRGISIVDDGNLSLLMQHSLRKPEFFVARRPGFTDRLLGRRVDIGYLKTSRYFSLYPLDLLPTNTYTENDYRQFRTDNKRLPKATGKVAFIGSRLLYRMVTSREQVKALIEAVCDFYCGRELEYSVHRFEDIEWLQQNIQRDNIHFQRYSTLIEYQFRQAGRVPGELATFTSSAIDSLSKLYPVPARVFMPPASFIREESRPKRSQLYRHYRATGIALTPLNPAENMQGSLQAAV